MIKNIVNYRVVGNTIQVDYASSSYFIKIINDQIINICDDPKIESFAVENNDFVCNFTVEQVSDELNIYTNNVKIVVGENFKVDFYTLNNQPICLDYFKSTKAEEEHPIVVKKMLSNDECIYGLGDKTGFLNKRGYDYIMWNTDEPAPHVDSFKSLYKSVPFLISLSNDVTYGIFFDNTFKTFFDLGKTNSECLTIAADEGHLNYYFIYGANIGQVISNYTLLTGRTHLPQIWTLGYQQSRWSYFTKEEVRALVANFKKYEIPLDVVHLDIDYMEAYKVFTTNDVTFPNFKEFIQELASQGIKVVTILDPGVKVEAGYDAYEEGIKNNYFATYNGEVYVNKVWPGDAVYPSFVSENVQEWWRGKTKFLVDLGVRGIWDDMNEPASFVGPLPDDVVFPSEKRNYLHKEVHNVYGHLMAKATYEGLVRHDKRRPYVITRACYSGTQKYSTVWTGDNHSIWAHLQMAIPQLCNLGLSGITFAGTDIGGFGSDTTKELLIRWLEASLFVPLFRNHAANGTRRQEPWTFDAETISIYKKTVETRYQFISYLYDLFYENSINGTPVMRPLVYHYSDDKITHNLNDEYLAGESILVAPVVEQGKTSKMVYLPKGNWIDYWTKQVHKGNQYIIKEAPLDTIPLFIKENSIIIKDPAKMYIDPKERKTLIIEIYGNKATYRHHLDDGESFDYLNGDYQEYVFDYHDGNLFINKLNNNSKYKYEKFVVRHNDKEVTILDDAMNIKVKI